jgi:MFS transporter, ACS family, pantothenate transporter
MNEMAYVLQAWLPLIVWQQVDAPEYQKGFITVSVLSLILIGTAFAIRWLERREARKAGYARVPNRDIDANELICSSRAVAGETSHSAGDAAESEVHETSGTASKAFPT